MVAPVNGPPQFASAGLIRIVVEELPSLAMELSCHSVSLESRNLTFPAQWSVQNTQQLSPVFEPQEPSTVIETRSPFSRSIRHQSLESPPASTEPVPLLPSINIVADAASSSARTEGMLENNMLTMIAAARARFGIDTRVDIGCRRHPHT